MSAVFTEVYQKACVKRSFTDPSHQKIDTELNVRYVEDFICVGQTDPEVLRASNRNFLRILVESEFITITKTEKSYTYQFKPFTTSMLNSIIKKIRKGYSNQNFSDSDLHDDVFEYFQIISPILADDPVLKENFIARHAEKFQDSLLPKAQQLKDARKRCIKFLNDRANLFCTYIFLRRCAILYRDTSHFKQPLIYLIDFLEVKENKKKLKDEKLMSGAFLYKNDLWTTGMHEWLERSDIIQALKRTAGYQENINGSVEKAPVTETHLKAVSGSVINKNAKKNDFIFSEFNWLDFQFLIRTPTKDLLFKHNMNGHPRSTFGSLTDSSGHRNINKKGGGLNPMYPKTTWKVDESEDSILCRGFDANIKSIFQKHARIFDFMREITSFYEKYILHDNTKEFHISQTQGFFSTGRRTDFKKDILAQQPVLKESHDMMLVWLRDIAIQASLNAVDTNTLIFHYQDGEILPQSIHEVQNLGAVANPPLYKQMTFINILFLSI